MAGFALLTWKVGRRFWPLRMLWFAVFGLLAPAMVYRLADRDRRLALHLPDNPQRLRVYSAFFFFTITFISLLFTLGIKDDKLTAFGEVLCAAMGLTAYLGSGVCGFFLARSYRRSGLLWGILCLPIPFLMLFVLYKLGPRSEIAR
jgi:hypothetical protein